MWSKNGGTWEWKKGLLERDDLRVGPGDIEWCEGVFREFLKIR